MFLGTKLSAIDKKHLYEVLVYCHGCVLSITCVCKNVYVKRDCRLAISAIIIVKWLTLNQHSIGLNIYTLIKFKDFTEWASSSNTVGTVGGEMTYRAQMLACSSQADISLMCDDEAHTGWWGWSFGLSPHLSGLSNAGDPEGTAHLTQREPERAISGASSDDLHCKHLI